MITAIILILLVGLLKIFDFDDDDALSARFAPVISRIIRQI